MSTTRHPTYTGLTLIPHAEVIKRLRCTGRTLDAYQERGLLHPIGHAGDTWYRTDEIDRLERATCDVEAELAAADPLAGGRGLLIGFVDGSAHWVALGLAWWAVTR